MASPYHLIHTGSLIETISAWVNTHSVRRTAVLMDSQVASLYPSLSDAFLNSKSDLYLLPSGEACKTLQEATACWNWMQAQGLDRGTLVIAVGGGATCDLVGFVASVFKRGLRTALVPTTLLAMVDAAFGGKTAINFGDTKNVLGTFWRPESVFVDSAFLETLDERDRQSGFSELVKYGFIWDPKLLDSIEKEKEDLLSLIQRAIEAKEQIVTQDPYDQGLRAILNFGHTLGHAIEALLDPDTIRHGEAVAMGMSFAAHLSCQLEILDVESVARLNRLLVDNGLKVEIPSTLSNKDLLQKMRQDKKNSTGLYSFVLLETFGQARVEPDLSEDVVLEALETHRSVRAA